jgi:hypothetical protein
MHTQNVNVKSAGEETAGRCGEHCLTDRQHLFNWVFAAAMRRVMPGTMLEDLKVSRITALSITRHIIARFFFRVVPANYF